VAASLEGGWGDRLLFLRVNGSGTDWHRDDMAAAHVDGFAGIVVPKVDSAAEAANLVAHGGGRPVLAMIETPAAVLNAPAIAAVPGVAALVAGIEAGLPVGETIDGPGGASPFAAEDEPAEDEQPAEGEDVEEAEVEA
jgi:citrate lyase beta subunit